MRKHGNILGMTKSPARNVRLDIQYDGTNYAGWQWQKNALSVQEVLTRAIQKVTVERVTVHGSGRTDAGVHALSQTANFRTTSSVPTEKFHLALNSVLPEDVVVSKAREVPLEWDARRDAIERHYRYTLHLGGAPDVFASRFAYHLPYRVDLDAMRNAAGIFLGRHDFSAYRSVACGADNPVRTMNYSGLWTQGSFMYYDLRGHAFLRNMVRIIVGSLLYVGRGKLSSADLEEALETGSRDKVGPAAPAKGLCMIKVRYPGEPIG